MKGSWQSHTHRYRRLSLVLLVVALIAGVTVSDYYAWQQQSAEAESSNELSVESVRESEELELAVEALEELEVKPRDPRGDYSREAFSPEGWTTVAGCDMRNRILQRDLAKIELDEDDCTVESGVLEKGPFTGDRIEFERGPETSGDIHIEHIVAVSDAWQKGAQQLSEEERHDFFNDPLNLIAIDGPINIEKGDSDAGDWMPPNKDYHCRYIARQIAIKREYSLWLGNDEQRQMQQTLTTCPEQPLPIQEHNEPSF